MQNEEAKEALKNEALDVGRNETNVVKEPTVPQRTRNNSRSPGKDRDGERSIEVPQNSPKKDEGGERSVEAPQNSSGKDEGSERSMEEQN